MKSKAAGLTIMLGILAGSAGVLWCADGSTAEAAPPAAAPSPQTLDNLMKAYDGESNAHARYLAFAKKADEEGYGQVASLFRAAAASEEIHVGDYARVIRKMGGTPKADVKVPDVKSTKENLEAALKGESYESDTMYPESLALAKKDGNKDAARAFNRAKAAETEHTKLYKEALANMDGWKSGKKDFYVCPECGLTVIQLPAEQCPVCHTVKEKFKKIN